MNIRESTQADHTTICQLHRDAFGEPEGEPIAQLVSDLFNHHSAQPQLSLVAEDKEKIIGHILFTPVTVDGAEVDGAYILAPMAVDKQQQASGIGTQLIKRGLEILKQREASFVLVLGDPNYYSRTGFNVDHCIKAPYTLEYPEAWMAQELKMGALEGIEGTVRCADPLHEPQHW